MSTALVSPTRLRCCSLLNPLGLGEPKPWLDWQLVSTASGQVQTAWQVLAADSAEALASDKGTLWDSGKVPGDASLQVPYEGKALASRQQVYWKVRAWDKDGAVGPWSEVAHWEMGLLEQADWSAEWVRSPIVGGKFTSAPAPFLRKEFTIGAAVKSARLYGTVLGLAEFYVNGQRVGDERFFPGWTNYNKRVQYRVWDVTALLHKGANAFGALLGDGWYCGHIAAWGRQTYGDRPQVLAQLELVLTDGTTVRINTDGTWKTATGPIVESDIFMGECYDARLDLGAWSVANYDDKAWHPVIPGVPCKAALVAMKGPAVRITQELKPIAAPVKQPGWENISYVFDMGQNFTGTVRIRFTCKAGKTVRIRYAEILDKNNKPYFENLREARATDAYTFATDGEEEFVPRFTFHGFRYIQITGDTTLGEITADAVTGLVLHSDIAATGEFECSNPLLNQLQKNIQWGQRGNFLDIPTDCPQRDERLGWTGDAQMFVRTACYNRDVETFFYRWQQDIEDAQRNPGGIPPIIPDPGKQDPADEGDAGPAWADAIIICPWTIYLCYGNTRILERHYPSMVRYIEFLEKKSVNLVRGHPEGKYWDGFGDWLAHDGSNGDVMGSTRKDLIGTAFFAYSTELLAKIAAAIGKTADAAKWTALHAAIVAAFQKRFVSGDGLLVGATQTSYVLALNFGLIPEALRENAVKELVRDIERRGNHLSTGFVGTPYLTRTLSDHGRLDMAYKLLEQTTFPSWLFPVTLGATTIWERWDGWHPEKGFQDKGMNSFNHYAYGAIGNWMYTTVAGIEIDPAQPAYKHILLRPHPGGSLTHAKATLQSPRGTIVSAWELKDNGLNLQFEIPANTSATLALPSGFTGKLLDTITGKVVTDAPAQPITLGSGSYKLRATA
ncbi:MAG: family 78 glycoside hydrolase catalytic domain [Verrucomicrobiota bacterium]|nr:family 78 glycoside hydrolase catalytic domain [Verrucomicrobiota bacterium]